MSLRTLSRLTGRDRGYLSRLERGQIRESADAAIESIAGALAVSPEAITHKEKKT